MSGGNVKSLKINKSSPLELKNSSKTIIDALSPGKKQKIYDFHGVVESVAWLWRLLGLFPIVIHGPIGMKKYRLSKLYAVYNCSMFALCVGNFIFGMMTFGHYFRHHIPMTTVTLLIRTTTGLLCLMLSNVWRTFRINELSESLNKISEQELTLEKIGCRCNYESRAKLIRFYVWTTFLVVSFLIIYDFRSANSETFWIRWVIWMAPLLSQMMDITIFVSLVSWIGFEFRALNEKIRAVVTRANASSPKIIMTSDVCAENLRVLSKAHYNICAIGKRINRFFDWGVIVNVITAFVILSTTLYYIFYEVERDRETDMHQIFSYIHWELLHSAPIVVIVISCNWTSRQGMYAGKLIHEIRVENTDSRMYDAIKSFSLQLHHQRLEFTACGFFPLNSTLIQTLVGKITTYLVILIQFQPNLDDLFGS